MSQSDIYIIAIGYDQDSKCKLLNAMMREKIVFTSFGCRRNLVVKKIKDYTIHGYGIRLVLTPSINTPAWKKVKEQLRTEKMWTERRRMFVYVRAVDATNVNNALSLENLTKTFQNEHVLGIDCYRNKASKKSFSPNGDKEPIADENFPHTFRLDCDWSSRASSAKVILEQIALKAFTPVSRVEVEEGPSEVGAEKRADTTQGTEDPKEKRDREDQISSVTVGETDPKPRMKEKLTDEDWVTFQTALREGTARSNHVRVNVVGNHGVGKTTVINRLLMKETKCPDREQKHTENLDIHRLTARCSEKDGTKSWETDDNERFLEDLNIQRMAQALEQVTTKRTLSHTSSMESSYSSLQSQPDSLPDFKAGDTPCKWSDKPDTAATTTEEQAPKAKFSLDFQQHNSPDMQQDTDECDREKESDVFAGSEEFMEDTPTSGSFIRSSQFSPEWPLMVLQKKEEYLRKVLYHLELLKEKKGEHMYVSYWDFAGQSTYYATHQLFLSPLAVYLLVVDLRKDLKDKIDDNLDFRSGVLQSCTVADALKFWAHSIQAYTKDDDGGYAPLIVVGTHKGVIKDDDVVQKKFKAIRDLLKTNPECIAIDNTLAPEDDENLSILRNKIIDVGLGIIDEKVSSQWINLEWDIQSHIQSGKEEEEGYLSMDKLKKLDKGLDVPMINPGRLEAFLCHQHYRGHLLFYQHPDLKDLIITDPIILVKFLNCLFRRSGTESCESTRGWNEEGILNHEYIVEVGKQLDIKELACMTLLKILVKLNILHPLMAGNTTGGEDQFFMPCMLNNKPEEEEEEPDDCDCSPIFQIRFDDDSLFQTTYHQIVCALMKSMPVMEEHDEKLIYNLHASLDVEGDQAVRLELNWKKCRINFQIKDFRKGEEKTMSEYVEDTIDKLEQAIEDVLFVNQHNNVGYEFWVACPRAKHEGSFLKLKQLKEKKDCFCAGKPGAGGRHMVKLKEIPAVAGTSADEQKEDPVMREKPTEKMLARLAWKLNTMGRENAATLALRLKLPNAFTRADVSTRNYDDPGSELFHILQSWKSYRPTDRTCSVLLRRLTRTRDYDHNTLKAAMLTPECKDDRIHVIPERAGRDNQDITIISDYIGDGYTFLLLETGVEWTHIQQARQNHSGDIQGMVRHLLASRRQIDPELSTRRILEAAKLIENPLDTIISKLQSIHV